MTFADSQLLSYSIPVSGFRSRKAAQMCALFAIKNGGTIEKLKLIKLIYFSDREFLRETGLPMLFDEYYSLYNGPICSCVLNGINGIVPAELEPVWSHYIARKGNVVVSVKDFGHEEFDEFSPAEEDVIDRMWNTYGHFTASQLRNISHDICKEYTEVEEGTRLPISYGEVLAALGVSDVPSIESEIRGMRRAESLLSGK